MAIEESIEISQATSEYASVVADLSLTTNHLFSFSEMVSGEDPLQNISEILIYSLTTKSVIYNLGIKDPLLDVFIREIAQEWISRIGYIPYKKSFIESIVDRSIDLYKDPELLTSVENLIDLISYCKKDPKAFEEEYVRNFVAEELEALGIRDLVNIDDPDYVKYVAYALYVMIVSKLDL